MNHVEHVVKFGSNLVTDQGGVDRQIIGEYVDGFSQSGLTEEGLIIVTSGAVVEGAKRAERIFDEEERAKLTLKQVAGLGCTAVFNAWEDAFLERGVGAASHAITHSQLDGRDKKMNSTNRYEKASFLQTVSDNADRGIVTLINEADALSDEELMKLCFGGDNDGLGSHLAQAFRARTLTIFAKLGGIFDDNKELIGTVDNDNIEAVRTVAASRDTSLTGRGGLTTKVEACWEAAQAGVRTRIAGTSADMSGVNATTFVVG